MLRIKPQSSTGFTLIELLITLAIVSILSVSAITIYTKKVREGRRIDGINSLLSISLAQERYRSNHTTYGTLAQVWSSTSSPEGYYTLSVSNNTGTGYTATATAQGNQASDAVNTTSCTTLTLTVANGTVTKAPSTCWPS